MRELNFLWADPKQKDKDSPKVTLTPHEDARGAIIQNLESSAERGALQVVKNMSGSVIKKLMDHSIPGIQWLFFFFDVKR